MSSSPKIALQVESNAELAVRQVSAYERISEPFVIDIMARSREPVQYASYGGEYVPPDPDHKGARIDLEAIVGQSAAIQVAQDDGLGKVWSGCIAHVEQVRFDATPGAESTYQLKLVPNFWLLKHRRNHRIFQHKTIIEIVTQMLDEWHVDYELRIDWSVYIKKEYCLQYGESDFEFVSRLLEEAGVVYFFEDSSGQSVMILSDQAHTVGPTVELPFASNPNEAQGTLWATNVQIIHRVVPGVVSLGDYNFRRPKAPLFAQSEKAPDPEGKREIFEYAPGGFLVESDAAGKGPGDEKNADNKSTTTHDADKEGKARAQRFLEAARHKKRYVMFESSAQNLAAGMVMSIFGHPHKELEGQNLLVIEVMDHLNASGDWRVVAEAVFTDVPYRVPRTTPKPRMAGVQTAIVVGPSDKEIYTDEFGRVRVQFLWDREGRFDDDSTCWLRVSQGWAGAQYGAMFVPRIGHEVIVDFLDGDPDMPVVVGRVYTQPSPYPYLLPKHQTRSTWQTNTSPSTDNSKNFNEIMFEDNADKELFFVQAERNYMRLVKRNETERTGENRLAVVGKHHLGIVGKVDSIHVGKQQLTKMVKAKNLRILQMEDPKTSPRDTWIEVVDKKISLTTGKTTIVLDDDSITVEAKKGVRLSADKDFVIKGSKVYLNAKGAKDVKAEADKKAKDEVEVPEGRVVNSIIRLFGKKEKAKSLEKPDELKFSGK